MYAKYEANLNIDGTGAIVAAPDLETPGEINISVTRSFAFLIKPHTGGPVAKTR